MSVSPEQLRHLLNLSRTLAITLDLHHLLPEAARLTCEMLSCQRSSVYFFDETTNELWTQVALGTQQIRLPRGAGLAGHVFDTGESVLTPDAYADPRFNRDTDKETGFHTRDIVTVPVLDLDRKPVGVLQAVNSRGGFSQTALELTQLVADQVGVAVQRARLNEQVVAAARLRHEMELAAKVQLELLPKEVPQLESLDVAGWSVPASVAGGDCYDLWKLPDGRLAMLVADAAGHGMAPAMVVAQVRSLVRVLAGGSRSPADVLNRVNARLAEDLSPSRFVTAVLAYLSRDGGVQMASAGHGPLLFSPAADAPLEEIIASGYPLVIDESDSVTDLPPLHLGPGGQLVLLSDGIFEAPSRSGEHLGMDRLHAALRSQAGRPASQQIQHLQLTVRTWSGAAELSDDQTIVIARRTS